MERFAILVSAGMIVGRTSLSSFDGIMVLSHVFVGISIISLSKSFSVIVANDVSTGVAFGGTLYEGYVSIGTLFIYFSFEELSEIFSQFFVTWCIWHWIWLVASSDFTDQFEQFSCVIGIGFNYSVQAVIILEF